MDLRRFLALLLCVVTVIVPAVSFAESYITQADIEDGIKFCAQYPVKLFLEGTEIKFEETDMPPLIVKSRTLIPARALFEAMGGIVSWNEETKEIEIHFGDSFVFLTVGSNVAWVDGIAETLEVPAMIVAKEGEYYGSTMIPVRFTAEALGCDVSWDDAQRRILISMPEEEEPADEPGKQGETENKGHTSFWEPFDYAPLAPMNAAAAQRLIAIDIGHGGQDTGAIGHEKKADELYEKAVNLKVGLYLRDYLKEAGASVYMIREKDTTIALLERPAAANNVNAQLLVSVHNNSSEFDWPTGTEVHYYSKLDAEGRDEKELYGIYSKDVAESVQKEMLKALGTFDRGIKNSPKLAVLNKSAMPAIIIEGAFLSNEENFEMIKTDEYAKRYAYAAAKGIIAVMNDTYK